MKCSFALMIERLRDHPLKQVGPGLITGVADDDPSGIATYSQAGAQFGLDMLWTMPLAFPLMAAIQSMCGRIGRVTGKGLAANIKENFPLPVLIGLVILLLLANIINISADIAAMGEAAELVTGMSRHGMTVLFVLATLILQVFVPYHRYVFFLKWLTLSLIAYVLVLFVVHVPWKEVLLRTFLPRLSFDTDTATTIVAIFGTTISPYLFFWQASEEVEDMHNRKNERLLSEDAIEAKKEIDRIGWDTWNGMFYSDIVAYFIILSTAVTLHAAGITDIQTAAQAAAALKPLAGDFASLLFALGILGVGLIGVPVLAGSGAYALCEALDWNWGLERTAVEARGFYGVITISVLAAILIQYSPIPPMKALFWSAVINGVVAVPLMVAVILLASRRKVMGAYTANPVIVAIGWLTTVVMAAAAIWMLLPT